MLFWIKINKIWCRFTMIFHFQECTHKLHKYTQAHYMHVNTLSWTQFCLPKKFTFSFLNSFEFQTQLTALNRTYDHNHTPTNSNIFVLDPNHHFRLGSSTPELLWPYWNHGPFFTKRMNTKLISNGEWRMIHNTHNIFTYKYVCLLVDIH